MGARLSNKEIDDRLAKIGVIRLGDHENIKYPTKTNMPFQCANTDCNHQWISSIANLWGYDVGCPICDNRKLFRLTNEEIDKRLEDREIQRLGDYTNVKYPSQSKMPFLCIKENCNHQWITTINRILFGDNCPVCSSRHYLTNEEIDKRLDGRNIKRLGDYSNIDDPSGAGLPFLCLQEGCGYGANGEWAPRLDGILRGTGCPECERRSRSLSNDEIDSRLLGSTIKRLGDFTNIKHPGKSKLSFMCSECKFGSDGEWAPVLHSIMSGVGCPVCFCGKNQNIVMKYLQNNNIEIECQKYLKELCCIDDQIYNRTRIDFYLPQQNAIIEYNGTQHYEPVEYFGGKEKYENYQVPRDNFVRKFCEINKISLITIDGRKYINNKLETYMNDYIIPMLCLDQSLVEANTMILRDCSTAT